MRAIVVGSAIVVAPGANAAFTGLTAEEVAAIGAADVLLCQLEIPVETVTAAAQAARAAGSRVLLNAAPARTLPDELLGAVDLLVVNQVEGAALARVKPVGVDAGDEPAVDDPLPLLDVLLEDVPRAVLTRGAAGAWYGSRDGEPVHVPAPMVTAVDTTAAGDAFTAALAVGWGEGRELVDAVRWASAAGAAAVRRLGASSALPNRSTIEELYHRRTPHDGPMRLLLNVFWLVFGGLFLALGYAIAGLICFILIVTIPFGIASFRMANYALWPFGRELVRKPTAGAASTVGNVIWFIVAGWWLALGHITAAVGQFVSIIGIPLGLANVKLVPVSLFPLGREIRTSASAGGTPLLP
jgi:uncharacterized membrane protein YccF (DUF307 family)/hydroxymethylpyrimidine/phosphomethylpyrimidine kinase